MRTIVICGRHSNKSLAAKGMAPVSLRVATRRESISNLFPARCFLFVCFVCVSFFVRVGISTVMCHYGVYERQAYYRRFPAGKPSFSTLYTATNVLAAGHYTSYGFKYSLPPPPRRDATGIHRNRKSLKTLSTICCRRHELKAKQTRGNGYERKKMLVCPSLGFVLRYLMVWLVILSLHG